MIAVLIGLAVMSPVALMAVALAILGTRHNRAYDERRAGR